jgi:ferredoxin
MLEILQRICSGKGKVEDIALLSELGEQIKSSSLCGLGQSAPNPVLTTLRYFLDEYTAHIKDKKCPAKSCLALVEFFIDPEKCSGCGLCVPACGVRNIGRKKSPHTIEFSSVRCASARRSAIRAIGNDNGASVLAGGRGHWARAGKAGLQAGIQQTRKQVGRWL